MGRIGPFGIWELLIILLVVLLLFGAQRLPQVARGIGESVREFRKGIRGLKEDIESDPAAAGTNGQRAEPVVSETPATKSS